MSRFLLTLLICISIASSVISICNIENPAYGSIISKDVSLFGTEIVYSERPSVKISDGTKFYFDQVPNHCYLKLVKNLSFVNPRVNVYSFYSDFELYKKSFNTESKLEETAEGFIVATRGTKDLMDVVQDSGLLFNKTPGYFSTIMKLIDEYKIENSSFAEKLYGFIGHSLGGLLSEMLAVKYKKKAVSIDSPGAENFIKNIQNEFKIDQKTVDYVKLNLITSYVSLPNVINKAFPIKGKNMAVIFSTPNSTCLLYYKTQMDFFKFKLLYIPNKIEVMQENLLSWSLYYHKITTIRDSILSHFKKDGFEIISKYRYDQLNQTTYNQDPKFDKFFRKHFECNTFEEDKQTYESYKAERIKEYEERRVTDPDDVIPPYRMNLKYLA